MGIIGLINEPARDAFVKIDINGIPLIYLCC